MGAPTAIVTGASRGIGKGAAVALARQGFDVAITARTVRRGDQPADPEGLSAKPLPGSLEETAEEIEALGQRAHLVELDLLDRDRLTSAAHEALDALGSVEVLVNNAIYVGPGNHHRFLDLDIDYFEKRVFANLTAQAIFTRPILEAMVAAGSGTILNVTSAAAYAPPFAQPGEGGWGTAYTASKGGFHRLAIQWHYEYAADGIQARNVQPGRVATERVVQSRGPLADIADMGATPDAVGDAIAHVAMNIDDYEPLKTIQLAELLRHR